MHVVPVRHHSPALARAVAEVIRAVRPQRVLIEGPATPTSGFSALAHPGWRKRPSLAAGIPPARHARANRQREPHPPVLLLPDVRLLARSLVALRTAA